MARGGAPARARAAEPRSRADTQTKRKCRARRAESERGPWVHYRGLMQNWIASPPVPDVEGATARVHLRYEDVCQDGRLLLEVMPNALGSAVWGAQLAKDSVAKTCMERGVIPILTRFVIEGTPGPFGVMTPLGVAGRFQLARGDGRVYLNMWAELWG